VNAILIFLAWAKGLEWWGHQGCLPCTIILHLEALSSSPCLSIIRHHQTAARTPNSPLNGGYVLSITIKLTLSTAW